jgi:hypothetical protein
MVLPDVYGALTQHRQRPSCRSYAACWRRPDTEGAEGFFSGRSGRSGLRTLLKTPTPAVDLIGRWMHPRSLLPYGWTTLVIMALLPSGGGGA